MKELAEQELKVLEAEHPTRFQYLKLQLKEFIHLLDEGDQQPLFNHKHYLHSISIVTQESSSSRKREREDEGCSKHKRKPEIKRPRKGEGNAIRKAEVCLRKIQTLKSLLFSSNH